MKRALSILAILSLLALTLNAQKEIIFKVKYKPETAYTQLMVQTSETVLNYSGSDDFKQKLKNQGVQNPTVSNKESQIASVLKTGKLTDPKHFPITMEILKTTSSDGKRVIPDGTMIYGHDSIGNVPVFDSIVAEGLDHEFKKLLLSSMQNILTQITFPEKKLKIGESFSQETPLSMPIAAVTIEMNIKTTYKLIGISNGMANFDINQEYTMKTEIAEHEVHATGSGKGQLQYDINNNFYLRYQIDTEMKMKMKLDKFGLDLVSKSGFLQTISIAPN